MSLGSLLRSQARLQKPQLDMEEDGDGEEEEEVWEGEEDEDMVHQPLSEWDLECL